MRAWQRPDKLIIKKHPVWLERKPNIRPPSDWIRIQTTTQYSIRQLVQVCSSWSPSWRTKVQHQSFTRARTRRVANLVRLLQVRTNKVIPIFIQIFLEHRAVCSSMSPPLWVGKPQARQHVQKYNIASKDHTIQLSKGQMKEKGMQPELPWILSKQMPIQRKIIKPKLLMTSNPTFSSSTPSTWPIWTFQNLASSTKWKRCFLTNTKRSSWSSKIVNNLDTSISSKIWMSWTIPSSMSLILHALTE